MPKKMKYYRLIILYFSLTFYFFYNPQLYCDISTADKEATLETKNLYRNLKIFCKNKILFGHQDDMAYGIMYNYYGSFERSDIKIICGEYPAVIGWDIGKLELNKDRNLDGVIFSEMAYWIKQAYNLRCINTISWHATNPVNDKPVTNTVKAVNRILPLGDKHDKYCGWLDTLAEFFKSLKSKEGIQIPIIFRPFHEHTHSGFWWGQDNCTTEEFIQLWRFTIDYLRNQKQVHNLLYAYSPHDVFDYQQYIERYPGDNYVDIMGVDYYYWGDVNAENIDNYKGRLVFNCQMALKAAIEHNKIAALTETGRENVTIDTWFTSCLLNPLKMNQLTGPISYALVWRNAGTGHHFAPYKGHPSEIDFLKFYQDSTTIFQKEMINLYSQLLPSSIGASYFEQEEANNSLTVYPNPFNNLTKIKLLTDKKTNINISVYDLNGKIVDVLFYGSIGIGMHEFPWNASNLTSGVYFIRLKTEIINKLIKCTLVR